MRDTFPRLCARSLEVPARRELPSAPFHRLRAEGIECAHIIPMGLRGVTDAHVMDLLVPAGEDVVLLTQDTEFEHLPLTGGRVLISRVPQNLSMERRIQIWMGAIREFVREPPAGSRFEITISGVIERLPD